MECSRIDYLHLPSRAIRCYSGDGDRFVIRIRRIGNIILVASDPELRARSVCHQDSRFMKLSKWRINYQLETWWWTKDIEKFIVIGHKGSQVSCKIWFIILKIGGSVSLLEIWFGQVSNSVEAWWFRVCLQKLQEESGWLPVSLGEVEELTIHA